MCALVLAAPAMVAAQTASDPRLLEFQSPDHQRTDAQNVPLIDHYELSVFVRGSNVTVSRANLGKPPLGTDGLIHVDLLSVLPTWPLPGGAVYEARVTAVGRAGSAISGYSNPFAFTGSSAGSATSAGGTGGATAGSGSPTPGPAAPSGSTGTNIPSGSTSATNGSAAGSSNATSTPTAPLGKVTDPQTLEFRASPDHDAIGADRQPIVRGYELVVVQVPANAIVLKAPLGKPTPDTSGTIRVNLPQYLAPTPPPGLTYQARVNALGAAGSASSDLSNPFTFNACKVTVTPGTTSFAAFPGISTATVTAPPACSWLTSSSVSWITIGAGGGGSRTVSYSVAPNPSTSPRTGSFTIAGKAIVVTQGGTGGQTPGTGTPPTVAAQFVRADLSSQGTWRGLYGTEGYLLAQDASSLPAYAQVSVTGAGNWTWTGGTSDRRALQRLTGTSRVAAQWYGATSFTIDVSVTDGRRHAVALYFLDWDRYSRNQTVDVIDVSTGRILDTRTTGPCPEGRYLIWEVSQRVRFRVTNIGWPNASVSGLFFDSSAQATAP